MTRLEFVPSKPFTLGVELELQLLDETSLDLADGIVPLLELYPESPYVKPEFIQNTVEIASRICRDAAEVEADLKSIAADLRQNCHRLGIRLCGAGTHPFCRRPALITPFPRYRKMERECGYLSHHQITYATHVHVGTANGEDAIYLMRRLKAFLPLLIALSANSPFWRGQETAFASFRHRVLAASRSYGIPPSFQSWEHFKDFFAGVQRAGVFRSAHDIHWDIRPRPHFGTVEVRVMDAQTTIEGAAMLAAFIHVLAVHLLRQRYASSQDVTPMALPWWLEKENHYQATRLGMGADFVCSAEGRVMPLRALWPEIFAHLQYVAQEVGEAGYLEKLDRKVSENALGYVRQRNLFRRTGSALALTAALADQFDRELNGRCPV